jgi:hypothetical protein
VLVVLAGVERDDFESLLQRLDQDRSLDDLRPGSIADGQKRSFLIRRSRHAHSISMAGGNFGE